MDKDIERVAQLIKENTSSDGKAYCISETAACEMFDLAEDLASHLQASEARVAELEKENEKYRSAFRTIQERRGKKFGGAPADFVVFDEYGKAICVLPEGNIHHPDQNK